MRVSWEIKKLGSVCENLDSQRKPITQRNRILGEIPYYGATGIVDYVKDYLFDEKLVLLGEDGAKWSSGDECAFMIEGKTWVNNHAHVLRPNRKLILDEWLIYNLNFQDLSPYITGMTVPKLNQGKMNEIRIPIPPLPEQKRIVAILDEAFAAIDKAKANILKNLQNAKELFESYLQGVFENKGEDWEEKRLKEIASVFGGYSFKSKDVKSSGMYQVLRMGNIRPGIIRNEESPVFIEKVDESVLKRALLKKDDVVITQTGTKKKRDYGFTVIIDKDNYLVNQRIAAIRFPGNYLSKFFLYYSWTNYFKDQYFANETGTVGQGNVGIGAVTDALVPFCSIEEQRRVVSDIDTILFHTNKLETIHQKKLDDLEELKKSILQKAFNGELTEKNILV